MATIITNKDGTLGLTLSPDEQEIMAGLPPGQLDAYLTLWLTERGKGLLAEAFAHLNGQDLADVKAILRKSAEATLTLSSTEVVS